jgi:hypothetical protein
MPSTGVITRTTGAFAGATSYPNNGLVFGDRKKLPPTTPGEPNVTLASTWGKTKIPDDVPDGLSNTIFFTEKYAQCGPPGTAQEGNGAGRVTFTYGSTTWSTYGYTGWRFVPSICYATVGTPATMFQVMPTPWESNCDFTRAATPHPGAIAQRVSAR